MSATVLERFWAKVTKTDECWHWTGCLQKRTYGRYGLFQSGIKLVLAHRFSYELHTGPIPDGMCVLHSCDTPGCVNPAHLFLGTHKTNAEDRNGKRREARGERHGLAKLTEEDILQIRAAYASNPHPYYKGTCALARRFGVSRHAIHCIITRRTWNHL